MLQPLVDITCGGQDAARLIDCDTNVETAVAGLRREVADLYGEVVTQHARYDRLVERIERLEKRLELAQP